MVSRPHTAPSPHWGILLRSIRWSAQDEDEDGEEDSGVGGSGLLLWLLGTEFVGMGCGLRGGCTGGRVLTAPGVAVVPVPAVDEMLRRLR